MTRQDSFQRAAQPAASNVFDCRDHELAGEFARGKGALKAPWLPLARTDAERALFARIRSALDPSATLNPNVLPRL
jgi:hypothetical protein